LKITRKQLRDLVDDELDLGYELISLGEKKYETNVRDNNFD